MSPSQGRVKRKLGRRLPEPAGRERSRCPPRPASPPGSGRRWEGEAAPPHPPPPRHSRLRRAARAATSAEGGEGRAGWGGACVKLPIKGTAAPQPRAPQHSAAPPWRGPPARRGCALPAAGSGAALPPLPCTCCRGGGRCGGGRRDGPRFPPPLPPNPPPRRQRGRCGARARPPRGKATPLPPPPFPPSRRRPALTHAPVAQDRDLAGLGRRHLLPRPVPNHIKGGGGSSGGGAWAEGERAAPPAACGGEGRAAERRVRARGSRGAWQQRRRPPHVTAGLASPSRTCASPRHRPERATSPPPRAGARRREGGGKTRCVMPSPPRADWAAPPQGRAAIG